MPLVQDPSKLTKDKLKEELRRYNVKLPPSGAKKQAYVDLYIKHISQLNDPSIFTDDFDSITDQSFESESSRVEAKRENESASEEETELVAETETLPEQEKKMNVEHLSDRELADELKALGFKPGPIGVTTRKVYEKKLVKLRLSPGSSGDTVIKASPKLFEQRYDEVPDDEDKQPPAKPRSPRRRPPPRRVPREDPVEEPLEEPEVQQITEDPVLTRRPLPSRHQGAREHAEKPKVPPSPGTKSTEKTGGIPMWLKFTILLVVVFFVYLVIANMEPSNKIPKTITDGT